MIAAGGGEAGTQPGRLDFGENALIETGRRQGLGEALLLRSFAHFRSRGFTRGTLGVDASSVTGATRLYERAGMRVYRDTIFLERLVRG